MTTALSFRPPGAEPGKPVRDLRGLVLGVVTWLAALAAFGLPWWVVAAGLAGSAVLALPGHRSGRGASRLAWLLAAVAACGSVWLHRGTVADSPATALARQGADVTATVTLTTDPIASRGRFGGYVIVHAEVSDLTALGRRYRLRAPVLLIGSLSWRSTRLGDRVETGGSLGPAAGPDLSGVLHTRGPPEVVGRSWAPYQLADGLRSGIRRASASLPNGQRQLVPALVDGDTTGLPVQVTDDFRTSGLTHLLAVSGTNLTLVVGFLLILARWAGVRARALVAVGAVGVVGFVLLARAEPSVLRAAVMGTVGLAGMGGGTRGPRALGLAVFGLVLVDPWLATSWGFALSASATAGIVLVAPGWRDALARWLPRWLAEAVAVPLAAQLACTPLIAAISGQVSLVAVAANLAAAPAVGPATVLGLLGGGVQLVSGRLARLLVLPAGWSAGWIVTVAGHSSSLPMPALTWSPGPAAVLLLALVCAGVGVALGPLLARPVPTLVASGLVSWAMVMPLPTPGWPPHDWVMVACDVGQGDGLVLDAGPGRAVVVDAGPDPRLMAACLKRLHVHDVPVLFLTHDHADHVDGVTSVFACCRVGAVEVSPLLDPVAGDRLVRRAAARAGVRVRVARLGEAATLGPLRWQVLGPSGPTPADSDSPPKDESLVLLVRSAGITLLLMGDEETPAQERLAGYVPGLKVDVLKVAHHGSAKQDPELVHSLGARLAVISDGVANVYGHPAPSTLQLLRSAGMVVARTDLQGDVAVVVDHGRLGVVTRMPLVRPRPGR